MRGKLVGLFAVVLLALVCLLGRITYINAISGQKYKKQVLTQAQQKYESNVLPAKRGDIYDRNGNILATSQKVYNVILDCKTVNSDEDYAEPTVRALVDVLGLDEKDIRSKLSAEDTKTASTRSSKNRFPWMKRKRLKIIRHRERTVNSQMHRKQSVAMSRVYGLKKIT